MSHKYKLLYKLEGKPEGFGVDEAKAKAEEGFGSCDAMLLASLIYPEDGSFSCLFVSADGRKGIQADLDDNEWFKVWSMLANRLANSETLSDNKKAFCHQVFEIIASAVRTAASENEPGNPTA
jgi:hypothetical protein